MQAMMTLKFDTMAHGGQALARDEGGRVVFVPYAIAGETARVEIVEARRGFARGRVVDLVEASPARRMPRCPHFPSSFGQHPLSFCGGCQWQHIAYAAQVEFKTQIVREQFARVAKMPRAPVLPMLPARDAWHYRNQMQFAVNQDGALCLQAPDSSVGNANRTLVPIRECHIMDSALGEMFNTLDLDARSFDGVTLRAGENTGDRFIVLESDEPTVPEVETDEPVSVAFRSGGMTIPLLGKEFLYERIGARTFRLSPDSFFQVNTAMAHTLVELVTDYLAPHPTDVLLDAYGGGGLFGLTLATRVARVIEIEENPIVVADARANASDLDNVEVLAGRVETTLPKLETRVDIAIVDPPRAGMERAALDALVRKAPRAIAYVSCDPATLARDVARLVQLGYSLSHVQPVDLFPQTYHVECVAQLVRA